MQELTERQRQVYEFIVGFVEEHGRQPVVREIGEHFGIPSPNGILCHLTALRKKGWLKKLGNGYKGHEIVGLRFVRVTTA